MKINGASTSRYKFFIEQTQSAVRVSSEFPTDKREEYVLTERINYSHAITPRVLLNDSSPHFTVAVLQVVGKTVLIIAARDNTTGAVCSVNSARMQNSGRDIL